MRATRRAAIAFFVLAIAVAVMGERSRAGVGQTQRAQIFVNIVIGVTPAPLGYAPSQAVAAQAAAPVEASISMHAKGSAPNVDDVIDGGTSALIAQQAQSALKVQAEVSPNPNATLLYPSFAQVSLTGTAGTTVKQTCIYQIIVDTAQTNWTLKDGLSQNPAASGASFPGTDVSYNNHLGATPQPLSSPFIVYPTAWTNVGTNSGAKTYCVDISVKIPSTTPSGTYSTNAVYTLYW